MFLHHAITPDLTVWSDSKHLVTHVVCVLNPLCFARLYEELTGVNDEISDLEDRLASLKDRANTLGKDYMKAKRESEAADKAVSVSAPVLGCAVGLQFDSFVLGTRVSYLTD